MKAMKKILCLLLSALMLTGILTACGNGFSPAETAEPEVAKLWFGYNTENFMQDYEYTDLMESRDSTLRMYGIRGETESSQLIITPLIDVEN